MLNGNSLGAALTALVCLIANYSYAEGDNNNGRLQGEASSSWNDVMDMVMQGAADDPSQCRIDYRESDIIARSLINVDCEKGKLALFQTVDESHFSAITSYCDFGKTVVQEPPRMVRTSIGLTNKSDGVVICVFR